MRDSAEREFQAVLGLQPDNLMAIQSLASLQYMDAQSRANPTEKVGLLDEAAQWYQKIVVAHPANKEAYYSLGVIAWAKWYPERTQVRQKLGMRPQDPGPLSDTALRPDLRSRIGSTVG